MPKSTPTYEIVARPTTSNSKTGNIPTLTVGTSKSACASSCKKAGCPLLPKSLGGKNGQVNKSLKLKACYAWNGTVRGASISMWKTIDRIREATGEFPHQYTVEAAIFNAKRAAKVFRVTALGDVSALPPEQWKTEIEEPILNAGLGIYGFTAGWRFAHHLKGKLMASNFTMRTADNAVAKGWRSTCLLPKSAVGTDWSKTRFTTPQGNPIVVCPHQVQQHRSKLSGEPIPEKKKITCNDCRLCVASRPGPIIGFVEH